MAKAKKKTEKKQSDTPVGNVEKSESKPDVEANNQDSKPDSEEKLEEDSEEKLEEDSEEKLEEDSDSEASVKTETEPATKKNMESDLPLVNLAVFCKLSGKKFDQIAGFRNYAKRNNLGPMTIPQWRKSEEEFQTKPMR